MVTAAVWNEVKGDFHSNSHPREIILPQKAVSRASKPFSPLNNQGQPSLHSQEVRREAEMVASQGCLDAETLPGTDLKTAP